MVNQNRQDVTQKNEAEKDQAQQANSDNTKLWSGSEINPDDVDATGEYIAKDGVPPKTGNPAKDRPSS